jgi:hypothetical protein
MTDATRDRYMEANLDMMDHLGEKLFHMIRTPKVNQQIQSVLDPIVNSIIQRVFPYILLSAILFLILFILSIATFWRVMNASHVVPALISTMGV